MRARVVLAVALAALGLLSLPSPPLAQSPAVRREVRVGLGGVPAGLEPVTALDGAPALVARNVLDTLVAYREGTSEVEPALATRWSVSRDGLAWSFVLREGVRFHDGSPLTAHDAAASFQRHLAAATPPAPAAAPVWAALLRGVPGVVREVRAADARTVEFLLVQPYAPLLTVLAHPGLGIVRTVTMADGGTRLVGTGPFRVADTAPGRLVLEAVPGSWRGPPRASRVVLIDVPSEERAEAELDAQALDVWLPPGPPRRTEGAVSAPGLRVGFLAFQTARAPFARRPLRQAVAGAVDPALLALALDRAAVPLPTFLPPGVWGRREALPALGATRKTIAALLKDGGWRDDLRPTLLVGGDAGPVNLPRLAESLQAMLEAAGMTVQPRLEPAAAASQARDRGEYDLALAEATVVAGDPHFLLYPLSTAEGTGHDARARNYSFYRNPRLDDVLVRASQLAFRPERQRLYLRAQAMLAEEVPWIPLYVHLQWAVARPEVRGLRLHPTGYHRLAPLALEGPP